jgi:hypothetical protein
MRLLQLGSLEIVSAKNLPLCRSLNFFETNFDLNSTTLCIQICLVRFLCSRTTKHLHKIYFNIKSEHFSCQKSILTEPLRRIVKVFRSIIYECRFEAEDATAT